MYWSECPPAHVSLAAVLRALTPANGNTNNGTVAEPAVRPKSREELMSLVAQLR